MHAARPQTRVDIRASLLTCARNQRKILNTMAEYRSIYAIAALLALVCVVAQADKQAVDDQQQSISKSASKSVLNALLSSVRRASSRSFSYLSSTLIATPITRILLTGGAILSLMLVFIRLVIVLGPILLLGALARESTDASDFLRMMIEFYNQVVLALDDAATNNPRQR